MISYLIEMYCDFGINVLTYIKNKVSSEPLHAKLLSLNRTHALSYLDNLNQSSIQLYCTRNQRHKLYKLLKGKNMPYLIYSYGPENSLTQKKLTIKCK